MDINFPLQDFIRAETPCYIYDAKWVRERFIQFKSIFPNDTMLFYSVKANPHIGIIDVLNTAGSNFEIASIGELDKVLAAGAMANKIIYTAPGKTDLSIETAILKGVYSIVVDSENELRKINAISKRLGRKQNIMFRLNTGKKSCGSLSMSGSTQFGMESSHIIDLWNEFDSPECIGIHCFQGSNIANAKDIIGDFFVVAEAFRNILNATKKTPKILNFGGGFPASEFDREYLKSEIQKIKYKFPGVTLAFESGRHLVAGSGVFLTKVLDIKELFGIKYVIVDGGINVYVADHFGFRVPTIEVVGDLAGRNNEVVTICGPLCTPLDTLARSIDLPKIKLGDLLAIYNAGAYQFSLAPSNFLSFKPAKETVIL